MREKNGISYLLFIIIKYSKRKILPLLLNLLLLNPLLKYNCLPVKTLLMVCVSYQGDLLLKLTEAQNELVGETKR